MAKKIVNNSFHTQIIFKNGNIQYHSNPPLQIRA